MPRARIDAGRARLSDDDVHYLRNVLRLGAGAELEVFDGEGGVHAARVAEDGRQLVIGPRREGVRGTRVQLAFALARGERTDLVVQKATELGVTKLSPFQAERSVVRLDGARGEERARRWRRIAAEAARQSGRADVPPVDAPTTLTTVLAGAEPGARIVVLYEGGGEPLGDVLDGAARSHLLVVGPEGGFVREEIESCLAVGARLATLGRRILRFETAAIVGVALLQYLAGGAGPDV